MQFCQKHWDALRAEIDKKGLGHLVSKDAEDLHRKLLEGGDASVDPMLMANNMIMMAFMEAVGPTALFTDSCPLCVVGESAGEELVTDWLDGCTTAIYNSYKEDGKLGAEQ
jgi:hypothetical protein